MATGEGRLGLYGEPCGAGVSQPHRLPLRLCVGTDGCWRLHGRRAEPTGRMLEATFCRAGAGSSRGQMCGDCNAGVRFPKGAQSLYPPPLVRLSCVGEGLIGRSSALAFEESCPRQGERLRGEPPRSMWPGHFPVAISRGSVSHRTHGGRAWIPSPHGL